MPRWVLAFLAGLVGAALLATTIPTGRAVDAATVRRQSKTPMEHVLTRHLPPKHTTTRLAPTHPATTNPVRPPVRPAVSTTRPTQPALPLPSKPDPTTTVGSTLPSTPAVPVEPPTTVAQTGVRPALPSSTTASTVGSSPAPTTTSTTAPPVAAPVLSASNGHLLYGGQRYRDVGVDAFEIATDWGTNAGCGGMLSDSQLDSFFASLPLHTLVRIWAFQGSMAVNIHTDTIDWSPLDRVFSSAAAHGDLLLVSLTTQDGTCDDSHWKDASWYNGGYRATYGPGEDNLDLIPYWDYVQQIVSRYSSSPALGMWEPVNEPEASTCDSGYTAWNCEGHLTCPDEGAAAQAMRSFFDAVGGEIRALDPKHLVEAGLLGGGQCGTAGSDYQFVGASPGLDVLSYHDYYAPSDAEGGDQWNGIAVRDQQAAALDKPLIAGESGIIAGPNCSVSLSQRASDFGARIQQQMQSGADAVLFWDWVPSTSGDCGYDITSSDPSFHLLGTA